MNKGDIVLVKDADTSVGRHFGGMIGRVRSVVDSSSNFAVCVEFTDGNWAFMDESQVIVMTASRIRALLDVLVTVVGFLEKKAAFRDLKKEARRAVNALHDTIE